MEYCSIHLQLVYHTVQIIQEHILLSNFVQHSYNASSVDTISIDSLFTANTADEARYVFAVLHHVVVTKCLQTVYVNLHLYCV